MLAIYSIHDKKMESFNRPFFMPADGAAIRAFQDEVNNKDSELSKHPEDYSLWAIGIFEEDIGAITALEPIRKLTEATTLIYREGEKNVQE